MKRFIDYIGLSLILFFLFSSCSEGDKNLKRMKKVKIGMSESEVKSLMKVQPEQIILNDTVYYGYEFNGKIKTIMYSTPVFSFSNIQFYFDQEADTLVDMWADP